MLKNFKCLMCGKSFERDHNHIVKSQKIFCSKICSGSYKSKQFSKNEIGKKYKFLTILEIVGKNKFGKTLIKCKCGCGKEIITCLARVKRGEIKRCSIGCNGFKTIKEWFLSYIVIDKEGKWIWKGNFTKAGYPAVSYKNKKTSAHRLCYELFVKKIPKEKFVCHRDDNPQNITPNNLFIGTHQDNMTDMVQKGRQSAGEGHWNSKLTYESIELIRSLYFKDNYTYKDLAQEFNVSIASIGNIINYKIWNTKKDIRR